MGTFECIYFFNGPPNKLFFNYFTICPSGIVVIHMVHFPFLLGMVDEAHVVWAMYCVKSGFSNNSVDGFWDVLKHICQTDPVSSKFQMGRTKLQYVINHGLFTHFKQMILDEILKSPFMSVLYDESPHKSIQKSEMDIHVRAHPQNKMLNKI